MKESSNSHDENLKKADRVAYLIAGHLNGTLTNPEQDELDDWITESDENLELFEKLTDEDNIEAGIQQHIQMEKEKAAELERVKETIGIRKRSTIKKLWPYLVAASVILLAASTYVIKNNNNDKEIEKPFARTTKNDVSPGSDKAVLTLSDGRTIILDSNQKSLIANEGNISIKQSGNGEIIYDGTDDAMKYNVVSTPRGGQYKLVLGDGTKVWLNAESSLKFPAGFASSERTVELHGEGFFEVAKNKDKPFTVKIITPYGDGGFVKVLGTTFNVNGYNDEGSVKTTLIEGSVSVSKGTANKLIRPGEQAIVSDEIKVAKAEIDEETAWKDGKFLFRDASVYSIGEQIKRWYDVEVEYQGKNVQLFNTEANRNVPLKELLDGMAGTGLVHFELEGRKLIIKP